MKPYCTEITKHLIAYLTRQLDGDRARKVKEHLDGCPLCGREAEELRAVWDLMGAPLPDDDFKDISRSVLAAITSAAHKTSLTGKFLTMLVRAPSPVLGTVIALLALPAGIYLGKALYLNTAYAFHPEEEIAAQAEELPLDIFNDFPDNSIGSVYIDLGEDS
jgi:anti-sigma factor RsiW